MECTWIFLQLGFICSAAGKLKRKSVLQNPGGGIHLDFPLPGFYLFSIWQTEKIKRVTNSRWRNMKKWQRDICAPSSLKYWTTRYSTEFSAQFFPQIVLNEKLIKTYFIEDAQDTVYTSEDIPGLEYRWILSRKLSAIRQYRIKTIFRVTIRPELNCLELDDKNLLQEIRKWEIVLSTE